MKFKQFLYDRIWKNNSSLVQLLGLCPVLAITTNVTNSIGLGITTTIVLMMTNSIVSILKHYIPHEIRIPIYMIIIASIVTCMEILLHAYQFDLYKSLGIFIPLIVTNCIIVARADFIAYRSSILVSLFDGMFIGLGSTCAMFIIGSIRELLGHGTLFFGINKIFIGYDKNNFWTFLHQDYTIILAILPSGGFMILGFIIALKNMINIHINKNDRIIFNCKQCIHKNTIKNESL
ncbi:electron transport complex subunit E [Buchnera aphidicola]|uniref:electron transport complex subunit E n=1 Tax=Buchnera aphidicola TaxID=9 RepID=UPI003BEEDB58